MAKYLIQDTTLINITDAVRTKTGKTDAILVSNIANEIANIPIGGNLNFNVVAYPSEESLPETAEENTIAIITNAEITSWIFIPSEPSEPSEGMVWIKIGTSSSVEFNALKENGIQICPISASQYIGGAWIAVTAKSFQNGWVNWAVYLFNNGDKPISGGWSSVASTYNGYTNNWGSPVVTINSDSVSCHNTNGAVGYLRHNNVIDLTPYNTVHISGTLVHNSGTMNFANSRPVILPDGATDWNNQSLATATLSKTGAFEDLQINIENVNEPALVCWGFYSYGGPATRTTVTINKIWLT